MSDRAALIHTEPASSRRKAHQPDTSLLSVSDFDLRSPFESTGSVLQLQRLIGNRAVSRLRGTASAGMIQRLTIFVTGPKGPRPVHINEYHFLFLLDKAKMTGSAEAGSHDVVLIPFDDFNGLGVAASSATTSDTFKYGDITWGWKGDGELFPVADDDVCFSIPGEFISELMRIARDGGQPTQKLMGNKNAKRAFDALPKKKKGGSFDEEEDAGELSVPFTFNVSALPSVVVYKAGKPGAGFLYPHPYDGNSCHVHLFFADQSDDPEKTVVSLSLTSRKSDNHFKVGSSKDGWQSAPSSQQQIDHKVNLSLLATARRSTGGASTSSSSKKEKPEKKAPEKAVWEESTAEDIAAKIGISVENLQGFAAAGGAEVTDYEGYSRQDFFKYFGEEYKVYLATLEEEPKTNAKPEKKEKPEKTQEKTRRTKK